MSTHNICFRQEIRKILRGYPLLFVAMANLYKQRDRYPDNYFSNFLTNLYVIICYEYPLEVPQKIHS